MNTAVIFDMDGVLVDSEPVINAAAIRALAEFGVQAQPADFEPFVGAGEDRYVGGVAELHGKTYVLEMKRRTYDWYLKLLPGMGKAFPGAKNLVELLRRHGVACAVASSADRIKVEANLTAVLGVQAAKAAGMRCVAVTTSFPRDALAAAGAELVRPAIAEITLDDLLAAGQSENPG